jgi:hypothetical protein
MKDTLSQEDQRRLSLQAGREYDAKWRNHVEELLLDWQRSEPQGPSDLYAHRIKCIIWHCYGELKAIADYQDPAYMDVPFSACIEEISGYLVSSVRCYERRQPIIESLKKQAEKA